LVLNHAAKNNIATIAALHLATQLKDVNAHARMVGAAMIAPVHLNQPAALALLLFQALLILVWAVSRLHCLMVNGLCTAVQQIQTTMPGTTVTN